MNARKTPPLRRDLLALIATAAFAAAASEARASDTDSDGLSDAFESLIGTNPSDDDTDADGVDDYQEYVETGTDPNDADTDGDGTDDGADANPLLVSSGVHSGVSNASHTGWATGIPHAWSGESPMDGVGVYAHNGVHVHGTSIGQTRGVMGGFALSIGFNSSSPGGAWTGNGTHSQLDMTITEHGNGDVDMLLEDGIVRTFTWNSGSSTFTSPAGCTCILAKLGAGSFERSFPTTACGPVQTYRYTNFLLDWHEDRFGNRVTYARDGSGRVTTITDTRGQDYTLTYYGTGRLETLEAPDGAVWTLLYNGKGQLHRIVGPTTTSFPSGLLAEFRYSNGSTDPALNDNLIGVFDGRGQRWLKNVYDGSDRVIEQHVGDAVDPFEFDYSQIASRITTVTDRAGNQRIWKWDATTLTRTELTEKTNRNVRSGEGDYVTTWTHDADGYLLTVEHPRGNGVKFTRNAVKLATEVRRKEDMSAADGSGDIVDSYTYENETKFYVVATHTSPRGEVTTYTNNADGQPTLVTFPTISHVSPTVTVTHAMTYNADGTLATFEDGEGKVTAYDYYTTGAKKGRLWKKTVDDGGLDLVTEYDYEAWGDVKSVKDPRGYTTNYTVERYGNVTKAAAPVALGYETVFAHDGNLNVTLKKVKNIDYDGTALTSPAWWETETIYDTMDQPVLVTEMVTTTADRSTIYEYDANDNLSKVIRDGREVRMTYDERDLLFRKRPLHPIWRHRVAT